MEQKRLGDRFDNSVEKIADLAFYTEGPACDSEGNYYCTTLSAGLILKVSENGRITDWARSPSPNGQIILPDDTHLVCDGIAGIRRFDPHGKWLKNDAEKSCAGVPVHTPNDLACDRDGNIFYTDSVRHTGKVCFKGIDGTEMILADALDFPNGIVLSADGTFLYVAESYKNRILKVFLQGNAKPVVFAELPVNPSGQQTGNLPDGLALDAVGNLWVAHYGMGALQVLSPAGKLLNSLETGLPLTSNVSVLSAHSLLFTGGYAEPGPGGLFKMWV